MKTPPKLLILDRDGTLIAEPPDDYQVDSLEKLAFLPGVITQLGRVVRAQDYQLVMITNQDGLGTEQFPEQTFWPPHQLMMDILEGEGITFRSVHIDRTFKHENAPTRKPGTALLQEYLDGDFDLANSIVIGDRPSDMQLAKNLGAKGLMIGKSEDPQDDDVNWDELEGTLLGKVDDWGEVADFLLSYQPRRRARVHRATAETDIHIELDLDGSGQYDHQTGLGFFDHMLDQLAKHSGIDLKVNVVGDLHIDEHHSIEDTGIALGEAFRQALGDKRGIHRYGFFNLPMDEALARVALDFSGRSWLVWSDEFRRERVGQLPLEMVEHFFKSFCDAAACNLNVEVRGKNDHHQVEAVFKGVARAIRQAIAKVPGSQELPSTKGLL